MNKGPDAYRTIGEASVEVGVEPYVIRFWETKFSQLSVWVYIRPQPKHKELYQKIEA